MTPIIKNRIKSWFQLTLLKRLNSKALINKPIKGKNINNKIKNFPKSSLKFKLISIKLGDCWIELIIKNTKKSK